jgi:hypothetical protein
MKKLFAALTLALTLVSGGVQTFAYSDYNAEAFERNHNLVVDYDKYQRKDVYTLMNEFANGRMDKYDIAYRLLNQCDYVDFSYYNDTAFMNCYNSNGDFVYMIKYFYTDKIVMVEFQDCIYNGKSLNRYTINSLINKEVSKCKSKGCPYEIVKDYTNNEMSRVYMKGIIMNKTRMVQFYNSDGTDCAPTVVRLTLA